MVTAKRPSSKPRVNYDAMLFSSNPLNRALARGYKNKDRNFMRNVVHNKTIYYSHEEFLIEEARENYADGIIKMAAYGIGGTMIATVGSPFLVAAIGEGSISLPALKTTLFGTANIGSRAYLTKAGFNMGVETTNQLITAGPSQLDLVDIGAQGFLGLNTPQSAAVGAVFDYKPFADNYDFVNLN